MNSQCAALELHTALLSGDVVIVIVVLPIGLQYTVCCSSLAAVSPLCLQLYTQKTKDGTLGRIVEVGCRQGDAIIVDSLLAAGRSTFAGKSSKSQMKNPFLEADFQGQGHIKHAQ